MPSPFLTARSFLCKLNSCACMPGTKRLGLGRWSTLLWPWEALRFLLRRFHLVVMIGHWEIILMSSGWEQAVMNEARSHVAAAVEGTRAGWVSSVSQSPARLESPDGSCTDLFREIGNWRDTDSLRSDHQVSVCVHGFPTYDLLIWTSMQVWHFLAQKMLFIWSDILVTNTPKSQYL